MLDLLTTLAVAAAILGSAMTAAFVVRLRTGLSGWIDTIWSAAVGAAGLVAVAMAEGGDPLRRAVAATLVAAWSLRLVGHIGRRTGEGGDDRRYAALVEEWGARWRRSLFVFLQAQAAAGVVLVAAIFLAARDPAPLSWLTDGLAVAVGMAGLSLEATADRQLRRWRATRDRSTPAICDVGLWGWSRHPNYLGEALFWWAWPLLAFDPSLPFATVAAALAPVMMAHLLANVSGIPPLEAHMRRSRGEAWDDYCRRVPRLLPWP